MGKYCTLVIFFRQDLVSRFGASGIRTIDLNCFGNRSYKNQGLHFLNLLNSPEFFLSIKNPKKFNSMICYYKKDKLLIPCFFEKFYYCFFSEKREPLQETIFKSLTALLYK